MVNKKVNMVLTNEDKALLQALSSALEGIAKAYGPHCEIILHSLENLNRSAIQVVNGHVTGRSVGAPLTNLGFEVLEKSLSSDEDVVGPYFTKLDDGRQLKCVTTLIRNASEKPIGMLCVNMDISIPLLDFFKDFLHIGPGASGTPVEHFASTPRELVLRALKTEMEKINTHGKISLLEKNKLIAVELYRRGIFNVRGAIDMVADELGVSRYTIYNYIREKKHSNETRLDMTAEP